MSDFLKKTFESIINLLKPKNESEQQIISEIKKNPKTNNLDVDFIEYLSISVKTNSFELPTIPDIITKIIKLTNDKNADFKLFSDIIKNDPTITLKLLQLANSSLYKGNYEITDVEKAISRIGIGGVQSLVISITLKNKIFGSVLSKKLAGKLWKKSLLTAIIIGKCAKLSNENESSFYTLGLLHNIGSFITLSIANSFIKQHKDYLTEDNFLERIVNSFENRVTKIVLSKWGFDLDQIDAIGNAENLKKDADLILYRTMYFAHQISKGVLSGYLKSLTKDEMLYYYKKISEDAKLNLTEATIVKIISESFKEFQTIVEMV